MSSHVFTAPIPAFVKDLRNSEPRPLALSRHTCFTSPMQLPSAGLLTRLALAALLPLPASAQSLDLDQLFEERNLAPLIQVLNQGDYELCVRIGEMAHDRGLKAVEWRLVHLDALRALGRLQEALDATPAMLAAFPGDLRLLIQRHQLASDLGQTDLARKTLDALNTAAKNKPAPQRSASDWTALGQAALAAGADAQKVIASYFQVARKKDPKAEPPYLAEGWLALEKNDPARAADTFRAGLKNHGETPALRHGLAAAFITSDRAAAAENITRTLEINPNHAGALLLRAELNLGAEKFLDAEADIQSVLNLDPAHPAAWALRAAALATTTADTAKVDAARTQALQRWPQNPLVDHTLGRIISRAYRFAEGAARQRQSLTFAPSYLPAKIQLCHDLLRLGEESEAFALATAIRAQDSYNIQAVNLGTLEKQIASYHEERTPHFTLKMPANEWPVYGQRALHLLEEAHQTLTQRYQLPLTRPVLVEFFPSQQDFAIRTFGNLGGQGILGACFGSVITMNSPGSLGHGRNNWESTLWHEFCHVVTLTATKNRMPRWLSEGLSVYEESQRDPAWGIPLSSSFRQMILDGDATPVSRLSQAFLSPKSSEHLMLAYYQAGQIVAYLVDKHGPDSLLNIIHDLAAGTSVNNAITSRAAPIADFESAFAAHLQNLAESFGRTADWSDPEPEALNPSDPASLDTYLKKHPNNLTALRLQLTAQLQAKDYDPALKTADRLITLLPDDFSDESAHWAKTRIYREQQRPAEETALLRTLAARHASALTAFLRLIELETETQSWSEVTIHAQRALALNPFLRTPNEALARSTTATGDTPLALAANRRLLILDPANASKTHYQLATLLHPTDPATAKRHLLDALAQAPRFRAAHELLLDLQAD
jgi:tetratricopeptide (TPR) repeat protein